jgi:transposase InsO family protein
MQFGDGTLLRLMSEMMRRGRDVPVVEAREPLIAVVHNLGHHGERAVFRELTARNYWWPYMMVDIRGVLDKCDLCLKHNIYQMGFHAPGSIHAERPGDYAQVDVVHMPESGEGHKYLLVLVDVFTGFVLLRPLMNVKAATVASVLWEWFCLIGPFKVLGSDNGPEFSNAVIAALSKHAGIHHRFATPYHPQGNAKVEATNRGVALNIVKMMAGEPRFWHLYVPLAQLVQNIKIRELTRSSPFTLMFGRRVNDLIDYTGTEVKPLTEDNWKQHQHEVTALVWPAIADKQIKLTEATKAKYEATRRNLLTADLPAGMEVYIRDPSYVKGEPRPREQQRNLGPYFIVRREYNGPYLLRDSTGSLRKVPVDQLIFTRTNRRPAPVSSESASDIYEVKEIIDHGYDDADQLMYRVWWAGFPRDEATWEPIHHINNTSLIKAYNKKQRVSAMLRPDSSSSEEEPELPVTQLVQDRDEVLDGADHMPGTLEVALQPDSLIEELVPAASAPVLDPAVRRRARRQPSTSSSAASTPSTRTRSRSRGVQLVLSLRRGGVGRIPDAELRGDSRRE